MAFSLKGIKFPGKKNIAAMTAEKMDAVSTVTLPMLSHIGAPAVPVVKVGDEVKVGTLVGRAGDGISSPVYSSVSGKVTGITEVIVSDGSKVSAVVIASDGEMVADESIAPPVINNKEDLVSAIKSSGIVGLGGAGFPAYVKFDSDKKLDYLIINATECEPYILSDSYTMLHKSADIAHAIDVITKHLDIGNVVIAIEKDQPEAISKMNELAAENKNISVKVLPVKYPSGAEKILVYSVTGKKLGAGKLPSEEGCIVCNCTTIAALGNFFRIGMPLVEKCVTVDGSAVKTPKIVIAPIGAALEDVLEFAGGFSEEPGKVLYGGPMMGVSVPNLKEPVLKNTNAIIAFNEKDSKAAKETACIQCGACTNHCPFGIDMAEILRAYNKGEYERLEKLGANLCMECGCCAYNCPAKRPLVQYIKVVKAALREWKEKEGNA